MKSHVRVTVIGGGVVGCSVLYHLTRLGWSDVMLIERAELTHGSTWHAARRVPHPERGHQHGRAPGLHHPALPRARGADRPVLRTPSRGRAHPRLGPGPPRLPQGRARQAPLHGARDRDRGAGGGRAALSHHEPRGTPRGALRSPRRAPRPRRHHPGVRPGGRACRGRRSCSATRCARSARAPTEAGTW